MHQLEPTFGKVIDDTEAVASALYSRMFGFGVVEDPATGNASGPSSAGTSSCVPTHPRSTIEAQA
jgi:predicted PhzF superfamily epimerase YddE/YHI9